MNNRRCGVLKAALLLTVGLGGRTACGQYADKQVFHQYEFDKIAIPRATADEPILRQFSLERALNYVEQASTAWSKSRKCVACHSNGAYLMTRSALMPLLGKPPEGARRFFVDALRKMQSTDAKKLLTGIRPTQTAYIARGLAEWDTHVTGRLSPETNEALRLMFELQSDDGSWGNANCWPPTESSAYQGTTVAAMAAATAPGWLASLRDEKLLTRVDKMKKLLETTAPHDHGRLLLLWTSTRWPELLQEKRKQELIDMVCSHQRPDGGWSIRTFAAPGAWGRGNRAEKLRAEPEFQNPPSDGHQTGLAVLVLREAGVPVDDERIKRGVNWLLTNQRQSGRWWTRSLNTDKYHYITSTASCYALLALAKCNALPTTATQRKRKP